LLQARPSMGADLLAAKVYRPRTHRSFKTTPSTRRDRVIKMGKVRRAVENNSVSARAQFAIWSITFEALKALYKAGAISRPFASAKMLSSWNTWVTAGRPAPALQHVELSRGVGVPGLRSIDR